MDLMMNLFIEENEPRFFAECDRPGCDWSYGNDSSQDVLRKMGNHDRGHHD